MATLTISHHIILLRPVVYTPDHYIFELTYSLYDGRRGSRMNFKPTQLHQKRFIWQLWHMTYDIPSKTVYMATLTYDIWYPIIFYCSGQVFLPQTIIFSKWQTHCMMDSTDPELILNPLGSFKNGLYGNSDNFPSYSITQASCLYPRPLYFQNDILTVRWTARIQNEF
jgi:hypothetical protein